MVLPGPRRTHPPGKEGAGAGAFAAQVEGAVLRAQGLTGLRGGEPLTLQIVPSNKLEEFIEPNDWQ